MTAIYIGDGDWIPGVPARNLTEEEYAKHKETIDANAAATGRILYMVVHPVIVSEESDMEEELDATEQTEISE